MDVAGILLCGGASRRFGANKLLAGDEPIALAAARNLRAGAGNVLAVLPLGHPHVLRDHPRTQRLLQYARKAVFWCVVRTPGKQARGNFCRSRNRH